MAELRYGIVTFKDQPVGTLSETPSGGTLFVYDAGAPTIACALPNDRHEHAYPFGLHPVFAHLAPEGWLRDRQARFGNLDKDDDFGILLAYGADCIGAIGVRDPANHHERSATTVIANPLDAAAVQVERTISGVQTKALCTSNGHDGFRPASRDDAAPLIAKYASPPLTDMVANEATTLELCRLLLGVNEVAEARLAPVDGIEGIALVLDRFDRQGPEGRDKLRCEDFAQVIGQPPGRDLRGKYDVGYEALGRALAFSAVRLIDARRLFKRLAVYVLVGNVDCHLKNFSLLETTDGLRLSPAYDILNGYIYADAGYTTRFGLKVGQDLRQWQEYDRALLLDIGTEIGLSRRAAEDVLAEISRRKAPFFKRLQQPLRLNEARTYAYRAAAHAAWERLYG